MNSITKQLKDDRGFTIPEIFLLVFMGIVALMIAYLFATNGHSVTTGSTTKNQQTSTPSANPYAILPPATVPPKTAECSQQVVFKTNGDSGPVQCSGGGLNASEWKTLATLEPSVLTLGYNASFGQVQTALCSDVKANISNPIELTSYQMAQLYYGWSFSSDPSVVLTNGSCQNVDD